MLNCDKSISVTRPVVEVRSEALDLVLPLILARKEIKISQCQWRLDPPWRRGVVYFSTHARPVVPCLEPDWSKGISSCNIRLRPPRWVRMYMLGVVGLKRRQQSWSPSLRLPVFWPPAALVSYDGDLLNIGSATHNHFGGNDQVISSSWSGARKTT